MTGIHETAASLRFFGDNLDPEVITATLGRVPTVAVKKGGAWLTSRGAEKTARTGSWRLQVARRQPGDLDGQIMELLAGMSQDMDAWRDFSARYRGNIFCGLFLANGNEGVSLRTETLAALGARGLILDLDIYGHEPSADADD
jgi:hypothetical protein